MPHLVLAGAGHAHLFVIRRIPEFLRAGWTVTVVGESARHGYSGMSPGVLGGRYDAASLFLPVEELVVQMGGRYVVDRVVRIDGPSRSLHLERGGVLSADLLSLNLGSRLKQPLESGGLPVIPAKPVEALAAFSFAARKLSPEGAPVMVAGGGAAGAEIAGNLRAIGLGVHWISSGNVLHGLPDGVRSRVLKNFFNRGIAVSERTRIEKIGTTSVTLSDGSRKPAQALVLATGTRPHPVMESSGLSERPGGGIRVDQTLEATRHPGVFAAGDCADFGAPLLEKAGVYAIRQGPVLAENLLARATGKTLSVYRPQKHWLQLLNLGDGTAVLRRGPFVAEGRWVMKLKDLIDLRFMNWARNLPESASK